MNTALFKKSPATHGISFWVAFFAGVVGGEGGGGWGVGCGRQGKNISDLYLTTVKRSCTTTSLKQIPPINTKIFPANSLQSEPPWFYHFPSSLTSCKLHVPLDTWCGLCSLYVLCCSEYNETFGDNRELYEYVTLTLCTCNELSPIQ